MQLVDPPTALRSYRPYIVEELEVDEAEFADEPVVMPELTFEPQTFGRRPGRRPLRDENLEPVDDAPPVIEEVASVVVSGDVDVSLSESEPDLRSEPSNAGAPASPSAKPKRRRGRRGRRKGGSDA